MTHFPAVRHGSRSEPGRLAETIGLALVIVGLANATDVFASLAGPNTPASGIPGIPAPLMLAMALVTAWLGALAAREGGGRLVGVDDLVIGLGLLAALAGLWHVAADNGMSQMPSSGHVLPWTALLGVAGMIIFTWRLCSPWLALTAIAAFVFAAAWHAATWRPDLDWQQAAPVDAALDIAATLWFDRADGVFGWVFDVLLSSVFPFFVLGGLLASRIFRRAETGSGPSVRTTLADFHAASLLLIPTLAISSLFMTERPGVDLSTIALVWFIALSACLVWFQISSIVEPKTVGRFDIMLMSLAFLTLVLALVGGASLQHSAIIALGMVIAFSFFDDDVKDRPSVLLVALARSGIAFGDLLVAAGAVGLILAVLDHTGLPIDVARLLAGAAGEAPLPLFLAAAITAIIAGLVMPGFAAYLIVTALLGPSLRTVGIADPTAHGLILAVVATAVAIERGLRSKTA